MKATTFGPESGSKWIMFLRVHDDSLMSPYQLTTITLGAQTKQCQQ